MKEKKEWKGIWINTLTNIKVNFIVCGETEERYTSDIYFGFKPLYPIFNSEKYLILENTIQKYNNNIIFYNVNEIFKLIWTLDIFIEYEKLILRKFSGSGVGVTPFIDETCGYKNKKKYIEILNKDIQYLSGLQLLKTKS